MKRTRTAASAAAAIACLAVCSTASASTPAWQTVYATDFNGPAGTLPAGWTPYTGPVYNSEQETYTADPANVALDGAGDLAITPTRSAAGTWTSGEVRTDATYGTPGQTVRFSADIKLPQGADLQGYWPAFWALGAGFLTNPASWPATGELDPMETVDGQALVHGTVHATGYAPGLGGVTAIPDPTGWHTYAVTYSPTAVTFALDGKTYETVVPAAVGPAVWTELTGHGYELLLNVAVGGVFPGPAQAATTSGAPMRVSSVTVTVRN